MRAAGIDIGSRTVKLAVLEDGRLVLGGSGDVVDWLECLNEGNSGQIIADPAQAASTGFGASSQAM